MSKRKKALAFDYIPLRLDIATLRLDIESSTYSINNCNKKSGDMPLMIMIVLIRRNMLWNRILPVCTI